MTSRGEVRRKLAAWLLTLPEPIRAADSSAAAEALRRKFDPNLSQPEFDAALRDLGYAIARQTASRYTLRNAA